MWQILRDICYSARSLRKNPAFSIVVILILAIGIGANTAVFSVVYGVLLKPLGYRDPSRLVVALHNGRFPDSPADYLDYKSQTTAFEQMEAAQAWGGAIETRDRVEVTHGLAVTAGLMTMLGVAPERGRLFLAGEDQPGATPTILISHRLWDRNFGRDPKITGKTILVDAHRYTVVGVMPPGFGFAPFWQTRAEMWVPLNLSSRTTDRGGRSLRVFARLKQNVAVRQAQAQLDTIARRLEQRYPQTNAGLSITVVPLHEKVSGPLRPTLIVLVATVALVLMIACANIANLVLTRAVGRRREIAVRLAIGAGRWRLVRQLAMEGLVVSAIGGICGLMLAWCSIAWLIRVLPMDGLPRQGDIAMHPAVLGFALAVSIATGFASSLLPAIDSSHLDVNEHLKEGSRGSTGRAHARARGFLVVAEVALALVLLVAAGLMIQTLVRLNAVDAGFDPHRLLTLQVFAPPGRSTSEKSMAFFQNVSTALASVPGIEQVSGINHLPISGDVWTFGYAIAGRPAPQAGHEPSAVYRVVRPEYFATMRIPLRGRDFTFRDNAESAPVVVVNETLARHQWPHENAIGKSIVVHAANESSAGGAIAAPCTIVGVAKNVRQSDWVGEVDEEYYLPYLQHTRAWGLSDLAFVARSGVDPDTMLTAVEKRVRAVDPHIGLLDLIPMERVIAVKLWRSRLCAMLLGSFAAIALVLAAIGIYGVIAYSVRQRTQEIGIRIALGATRWNVMQLAVRESMVPVMSGIVVGVAISIAASRWLETLLYGVTTTDPITFAGVIAGLALISLAATCIPAWQVLRADVLSALRNE